MPRKASRTIVDTEACLRLAEQVTGHEFADKGLLLRALTHPSAIEERDPEGYYERLEFLGDAVLGFVVAEEIFGRFPAMAEGGMTRLRASVVNGSSLSAIADELGLGDAIIVGESERNVGSRGRASALENAFEALTAALYLDAGLDRAREWVRRTVVAHIRPELAETLENPKSALQELVQVGGETPNYRLLGHEGPPHDRVFTVEVIVAGEVLGTGSGRSKKDAEAAAAAQALELLATRG